MKGVCYSQDFTKFLENEVMVVYTLQRTVKITSRLESKVFREVPRQGVTDDKVYKMCQEIHKELTDGDTEK